MENREVRVLNIIGKRPTGGIGAVVYNYQSHFKNKNLKIDYMLFTTGNDGEFDRKVKKLGSNVYIMPELKYSNVFKIYNEVEKFFKGNIGRYQAVHLHSTNIGFICYPLAKKYGIKHLIAHSHATVYSEKKVNAIRNAVLCVPLKYWANTYMACSIAAANFLYGEKFVKKGRVHILNNAIEYGRFKFNPKTRERIRDKMNLNDKLVIGNVGRFNEQKNHLFIIEIFKEIKKREKNVVLILIGEGPLRKQVEEKVKKYKLEQDVVFLGIRNDISDLLQGMDIFLLPSLYEGLPVIGVEAQVSGLACVMSDTITKEVDITNVKYIGLDKGVRNWAEEILKIKRKERHECTLEMIRTKGFDIEIEAEKLAEIYSRMEK